MTIVRTGAPLAVDSCTTEDGRVIFVSVTGTGDWIRHEVTAQVPADAMSIIFGVYLNGRGQVELRNPALIRHAVGDASQVFPDSQAGYVLPVKRPVRVAEALDVGDVTTVTVELIDFPDGSLIPVQD